jgi:serine/threonine protein phosphatase PrpC
VITRALGIDDEVIADVTLHEVQQNDTFLLCTDGLTEMLEDHEIGMILKESAPREAAQKLLDGANNEGGLDNITVVVVKVTER